MLWETIKGLPMTATYQASPLKRAKDDLARLDETIARLKAEREKVIGFIDMYEKYAGDGTSMSEAAAPQTGLINQPAPTGLINQSTLTGLINQTQPLNIRIRNFLAQKLSTIEKPIPISTVFEMLYPNNLIPGGKDPKQALSAILGKDKRFKYKHGEGWSLVLQPTFSGPEREDQ
jgi:hypothetical protein